MLIYWGILLIIFLCLWIFLGGRKHEFVGLKPLFSHQPLPEDPFTINPFYINHLKQNNLEGVNKQISYRPTETCVPEEILPHPIQNQFPQEVPHYEQRRLEPPKENPTRTKWKYQSLCCKALEEIYNKPFISVRPSWLKNPETNGVLEIDCYNDDLKIGVEYNGMQHYVYPNIYHKTQEEFIKLVRRDQYKHKKCDENGVYLITVPYNVPQNKIKEYIQSYLPENISKEQVDRNNDPNNNLPLTTYKEYLA
jgi:hypothetical protein